MNVQAAGIKPHAAATSKRLRLWNLAQTKVSAVKRAGNVFAAFGHADVDV
jgi:hypothetical protein